MTGYALPIQRLIKELGKLPGIGEKTATRLATFILRVSPEDARKLADSILEVKSKIRFCSACFNLAEGDLCEICMDYSRDKTLICVVEEPDALIAIEESGSFRGTYHVLHGALSPLDGIGPDQLRIKDFLKRIENNRIEEIVVATNPSVQGEATALLINKVVKGLDVKVSRIALGVPVGSDLKYMDKMTLSKSMEYRRRI
jgi:recombination protein RecR